MNKMKVLQINTTLNWGSTGRIAEDIGLLIKKCNGTSYIAFGRNNNPSQSQTIRIGNKFDFYFHALQTRIFDNHGLSSLRSTNKLIEDIQNIKPDIIHLHNIHGYYLNYTILFDYLSQIGIPIVWTLHDCWSFTGHCAYYSYAKCDRWKTECYNCPQKGIYPASILKDRSRLNYRDKKDAFTSVNNMTLVPVSNWLADEIKESFLSKYPIKVIHNGVDLSVFKPSPFSLNNHFLDGKFVILGVANVWERRKGLMDFLCLHNLLSSQYVIILIGLTKKQIKELPKGIVGIERTNNVHELVQYYSRADVFFNPTLEDNFPTTNLEALACGTPIITYRTGGSVEAVDISTGFIVEQGNVEDVMSKIEYIKTVGKDKYAKSCRQRAVDLYDKNKKYLEYIHLYQEILNK